MLVFSEGYSHFLNFSQHFNNIHIYIWTSVAVMLKIFSSCVYSLRHTEIYTMYSSESSRMLQIKQGSVSELSRPWKPRHRWEDNIRMDLKNRM